MNKYKRTMPKSCQIHVMNTLFRANGKAQEAALSSRLLYHCWEFERGNLTQELLTPTIVCAFITQNFNFFFFRFTHKQQAAFSTILVYLQKNLKNKKHMVLLKLNLLAFSPIFCSLPHS